MKSRSKVLLLCFVLFGLPPDVGQAAKWSGYVAAEFRAFPEPPLDGRQHGDNLSFVAEPEFYHEWNNGRDSFTFAPFLRLDQHDDERSHFDIRELTWLKVGGDWELRVGIRKLYWGVAESLHLVDIINQADLVETLDQEDKLGQPMINLALIRRWGTVDLFLLPGFRERTFPGVKGRLRTPLPVDTEQAAYESPRGNRRLDAAIRWSHTVGDWDLGLSHFSGTSREPRLLPGLDKDGKPILIPYYDIIDQTGLDVQATKGGWLWKLEAIRRAGQGGSYYAAVGGLEYTFYGGFKSPLDLGLVTEYLYDDRGNKAPTPFQDDLMMGLRLSFNDTQSTEALIGAIVDLGNHARFYNVEASRRLGHQWKLSLEARWFAGIPPDDPIFGLRADDYIQVELARYF